MKYDFDLDMVSNNSLSLIARRIKKKSKVLEFGPAHGRLTKYLKENLECEVYIVEIDELAVLEAKKFSKDSVVGDIEDYKWLDIFMDIEFDFIIFADVLEHLRNPKKVLQEAKKLLQYDGSIVLSVPNMAHNAVIVDLLNNKLEYKEVGLLDNTHIKFFTIHSLDKMLEECHLYTVNKYATYAELEETEFNNNYGMVEGIDFSFWKERDYGTLYQFVYEVKKSRELVVDCNNYITKNINKYLFKLYFDFGNGFNEEDCYKEYISTKESLSEIKINVGYENKIIKKIRIDFLDKKCCIEINEILAVLDDGREMNLKIDSSNANTFVNDKYYFNHDDPQGLVVNDNNYVIKKINLNLYIYLTESLDLDFITSELENLNIKLDEKDLEISNLIGEKEKLLSLENSKETGRLKEEYELILHEKEEIELKMNKSLYENTEKELKINNLINENAEKELRINTLKDENIEKELRINTLKDENIEKELRINTLKDENVEKELRINTLKAENVGKEIRINTLKDENIEKELKINHLINKNTQIENELKSHKESIQKIYDSNSWKLTSFFRKMK